MLPRHGENIPPSRGGALEGNSGSESRGGGNLPPL